MSTMVAAIATDLAKMWKNEVIFRNILVKFKEK